MNHTCPVQETDLTNFSVCHFFPDQCEPDRPFLKVPTGEFTAKLIVYLIVFIGSFLGNIMVIIVVYLYRAKMQSSAYIYLLNLSVAGLIIALGCMWPYFMVSIAHEYPLGAAMCKIHPFLQLTSMVSSVLTLATISLDQFVAVAFPIHARFTSRLRPVWVIAGIWIIAVIVSIPFLVHKEHIEYRFSDHSKKMCAEAWPSVMIFDPVLSRASNQSVCVKYEPSKTAYYTFITAALFFFPVGVMIAAYTIIMRKVWSAHVPGDHQEHNHVHAKSKAKVVKLVAAVLVGFLICWMPLQVLIFYERYNPLRIESGELPGWIGKFSYFAYFIAYANSAINPLIYCFLNGKFRQGFLSVLTCRLHNRRQRSSLQDGGLTETGLVRPETTSRKSSRAVSFHVSNQSTVYFEESHNPSKDSEEGVEGFDENL